MHSNVADYAFEPFCQGQQFSHFNLVALAFLEFRCFFAGVDHACVGRVSGTRKRYRFAGRRGHQFGDAVDMAIPHSKYPTHVA